MELLEVTEVRLEWRDLDNLTYHKRPDDLHADRSKDEDIHVSEVLRYVAKKLGRYTQEDQDDEMPLRVLLGLGFEEQAARLYPRMCWQYGRLVSGGIVGNPDGVTPLDLPFLKPYELCVDEFKYTGKSQRVHGSKDPNDLKDIRSEFYWIQQGASYVNLVRCLGLGPGYNDINLCRFHICWKFGSYVYPLKERYFRYLVRFDEKELEGNWRMLQENKEAAMFERS